MNDWEREVGESSPQVGGMTPDEARLAALLGLGGSTCALLTFLFWPDLEVPSGGVATTLILSGVAVLALRALWSAKVSNGTVAGRESLRSAVFFLQSAAFLFAVLFLPLLTFDGSDQGLWPYVKLAAIAVIPGAGVIASSRTTSWKGAVIIAAAFAGVVVAVIASSSVGWLA